MTTDRRRYTEDEAHKLKQEIDERRKKGEIVDDICEKLKITKSSYYRWCEKFGKTEGIETMEKKRYTDEEKKELIKNVEAKVAAENISIKKALDFYGISNPTYYTWKNKSDKKRKYTKNKKKTVVTSLIAQGGVQNPHDPNSVIMPQTNESSSRQPFIFFYGDSDLARDMMRMFTQRGGV